MACRGGQHHGGGGPVAAVAVAGRVPEPWSVLPVSAYFPASWCLSGWKEPANGWMPPSIPVRGNSNPCRRSFHLLGQPSPTGPAAPVTSAPAVGSHPPELGPPSPWLGLTGGLGQLRTTLPAALHRELMAGAPGPRQRLDFSLDDIHPPTSSPSPPSTSHSSVAGPIQLPNCSALFQSSHRPDLSTFTWIPRMIET